MRVRKGLWSLRRGSAVPPRSADHPSRRPSAPSAGSLPGPDAHRGPMQAQQQRPDRISPGVHGAVAARSRDPLRASSAAAHAVVARFL
jgi:hypothetical protein